MVDPASKSDGRMKDRLEMLVGEMIEKGILFNDAIMHFEKQYIGKMLKKNGGNITKTAEDLGIHRNTLSKKVDKYKL
jgi:DNA-binding NtrC family response regulator